jgi:predicted component of type VI protein secretion system
MNIPVVASAAVAILLVGGCSDHRGAQLPTATEHQALHSAGAEEESTSSIEHSTVCTAYERRLGRVQLQLAENPDQAMLEEQASTLRAVIADACN